MIKYFTGLLGAAALLLTSCPDGGAPAVIPGPSKDALLILIDKTISSAPDAERQEVFRRGSAQAVLTTLQNPGDVVQGHFIQQNTAGATAFLQSEPVPVFKAPERGGGKSLKDAERRYKAKLQTIQGICNKKLREAVQETNNTKTRLYTDLWGILEVGSRTFSRASYDTKTIHILSDLEESMRGEGRRDFHNKPITSKSEAIAFAKADAQTLQEVLDIDPTVLAGTKVVVYPPFNALEASGFALNRYYWEALFEAFGITEVVVK